MKTSEYNSVANFIGNTIDVLDNFIKNNASSKSLLLASKVIMAWSEAAAKDLEKYRTPEKATKAAALLKALAELIL